MTQNLALTAQTYNTQVIVCGDGLTLSGNGASLASGVIMQGRSGVTIDDVNGLGVLWTSSSNNTVTHCTGVLYISMDSSSNSNTIISNNVAASSFLGLSGSNNRVENNVFNSNPSTVVIDIFQGSMNNLVQGNTINGPAQGISLGPNANSNTIINNHFVGNGAGVWIGGSHDNRVRRNRFQNCAKGVAIYALGNYPATGNIIAEDTMEGCTEQGIWIFNARNNTVMRNMVRDNQVGIMEDGILVDSNLIINNNIIHNTGNQGLGNSNFWDDAICGGNYWSDYDEPGEGCVDTDGNGICDNPRPTPPDSFPFVNQDGWLNHPIPPLISCLPSDSCLGTRDRDGDALWDCWEINGYDRDGDGIVDVDLPAMGANYLRKDVFVETDWMEAGPGEAQSHQPKVASLNIVINSFANAPVSNPNGTTGISLHVDYGQGGPFTGGNAVPHDDDLNPVWTDFDAIKNANFAEARRPIFHYCLFAHRYNGTNSSGVSRNPDPPAGWNASDFAVTLGGWPTNPGTVNEQAGTFMHELGHNLGLKHGGGDHTNYKPNYLSVMSYAFQTRGLRFNGADGRFDYSRFDLPALDENNLDENVGLNGGPDIANYGTRFYVGPGTWDRCLGTARTVNNANGSVNWNDIAPSTEMNVATNINNCIPLPNHTCDCPLTTLSSFNDWPNLVFNGGLVGGGLSPGDLPMQSLLDTMEITYQEDLLVCTPRGDLNGDGQYTPADVVLILNLVFAGTLPPSDEIAGDLDCNGQHSPADVVQELNFVFFGSPRPCCL